MLVMLIIIIVLPAIGFGMVCAEGVKTRTAKVVGFVSGAFMWSSLFFIPVLASELAPDSGRMVTVVIFGALILSMVILFGSVTLPEWVDKRVANKR